VFFTYTLQEGDRPDIIAEKYYEDSNFAWLIYYANEIIDPYFEWPMQQNEFEEYLKIKYGSIAYSQEKILFFRNNWHSNESMISTSAYGSLPSVLKKYWAPIYNYKGDVMTYERAKLETVVETNMTVSIQHNGTTPFTVDDIVKQGSETSGVVKSAQSGIIIVDKIQGQFTAGAITNFAGTTTATVTSATIINQPLSDVEASYWNPVTVYEYEEELNASKKEIYIIDKSYLDQIEMEMKTLLI